MKKFARLILAVCFSAVTVLSVGCGDKVEKVNKDTPTKIELPTSDFTKTEHKEVTFSIRPETVKNTGMTFTITNNTSVDITYGTDFYIEQYYNDNWYEEEFNSLLMDVAMTLKPKESNEQTIQFDNLLDPGKYRIIKYFNIAGEKVGFDSEFEITAN